MNPRVRATVVITAIAIASGIAGAAIDRTFLVRGGHRGWGRPAPNAAQDARRRADMLDRMDKDLGLNPAQRVAIDSVLQHTDSALHAIRQSTQPQVQHELEQSRAAIAARLDPAQRDKFLKHAAERDRRRRHE